MVLPIDAIVPIYYSGSVNLASTNYEAIKAAPLKLVYVDGVNRRHVDIPFIVPIGSEVLVLAEVIARKVVRAVSETITLAETSIIKKATKKVSETLTLSESVLRKVVKPVTEALHLTETTILRKVIRPISETLHLAESILRKVVRKLTETLTLTESILRKVIRPVSETLHLAESILRKVVRKLTETLTLTESIVRKITRKLSESLGLAESILRKVIPNIPMFTMYDDFESGTYTYSAEPQASPNNLWTVQFRGGGTAGVHTPTSSTDTTLVAFQTPQVAASSGQSFSALVTSNSNYTDFTLEFDVRTIAQIRTGSAPNNWEVAWIFWHWTDNSHQYYFTPKMSGTEMGKTDTGGTQIIMATTGAGDFSLTLGQWYHVKIVVIGNHFKAYINGTLHIDYTDLGQGGFPSTSNFPPSTALYSGKVGMYCEDSQVEFDNISITPIESIFLNDVQNGVNMAAKVIRRAANIFPHWRN